jgi:hypothetical protein
MENLIINILSSNLRYENFDGRNYLVAPATIIVPGVLCGSEGPLLYPEDEVEASTPLWDFTPIVLNHPEGTAKKPQIIAEYGLGLIFNTKFTDELTTEAWFDIEKTRRIDSVIYNKLITKQPIELSTGVALKKTPVNATEDNIYIAKNGKQTIYTHIVSNLIPDHLAILQNEEGACSIKDGCGVNNKKTDSKVKNENSLNQIREELNKQLQDRFKSENRMIWVEDVYETYIIFEKDSELFRLDYTKENGLSKLSESTPVKVIKKVEFIPVLNKVEEMEKKKEEVKKGLIDNLIKNCGCGWEETDREVLNAFSEEKLKQLTPEKQPEKKEGEEVLTTNSTSKNIDEKQTKPLTIDDLDPAMQKIIRNAQKIEDKEKEKFITKIVANVSDEEKKKALITNLKTKELEELELLSDAIPEVKKNDSDEEQGSYFGGSMFVDNSSYGSKDEKLKEAEEDILAMSPPPMKWLE